MDARAKDTSRGDDILAKRDGLMAYLRESGLGGVWGVGLTRVGGTEHLLLMVSPDVGHLMPEDFQGVPVTVRVTKKAKLA